MIKCTWPSCENEAEFYLIYEVDHSALVEDTFCFHHAYLTSQKYPVYSKGSVSDADYCPSSVSNA